jgi:TrmH family RNA methyltransferase
MPIKSSRGSSWLERVRVVLVGTTHPGNIGASARAMKGMGFQTLHLVTPQHFPSAEATARAAGADDVLADAVVHASLEDALQGCQVVYGTSARARRIGWPTFTPRAAAADIAQAPQSAIIALVFGRERTGLTNAELDLCQRLICIPTVADFSSLNIAQAVQICAYELALIEPDAVPGTPRRGRQKSGDTLASAGEIEALRAHCMAVMARVEYYDPLRPKLIDRRLRRLLARSNLLHSEVQIFRGFLTAIEDHLSATD